MSDVISSGMVHTKLSPLGWESQPLLTQQVAPWEENGVGSWCTNITNARRYTQPIPGAGLAYIEECITCSIIRVYCGRISMLIKKESVPKQEIDYVNMRLSLVQNAINIDAYYIDDRGIISDYLPIYAERGLLVIGEWYNVNLQFGFTYPQTRKEQKRIIVIKNTIASGTINMPEGQRWNDISGEKAYVKNIITTPLSLSLFEQQIGSKENQISGAGILTLSSSNPTWFLGKWNTIPNKTLSILVHNIFSGVTRTRLNNAAMTLSSKNPTYIWNVPLSVLCGAKIIYTMTITGSPDIEIPISSFQSIVRQGGSTKAERDAVDAAHDLALADLASRYDDGLYDNDQAGYDATLASLQSDYAAQLAQLETQRASYLSCVVPNSLKYVDDISSRLDGLIIIKRGYELADGSRTMEEITRANFDYLAFSRGAHNDSATITGYKIKTYTSPKTRTVSGVSFISLEASGRKRIRAAVDLFLKPNDVCVYGAGESEYFTVGQITYSVNERSATMEVTELDEIL